jgi:hypothetical protein
MTPFPIQFNLESQDKNKHMMPVECVPVCEPPFFPVKLTDGYLLVLKVHRMYLSTNYNQNPQALCPSNGFFPQLKKIV